MTSSVVLLARITFGIQKRHNFALLSLDATCPIVGRRQCAFRSALVRSCGSIQILNLSGLNKAGYSLGRLLLA